MAVLNQWNCWFSLGDIYCRSYGGEISFISETFYYHTNIFKNFRLKLRHLTYLANYCKRFCLIVYPCFCSLNCQALWLLVNYSLMI